MLSFGSLKALPKQRNTTTAYCIYSNYNPIKTNDIFDSPISLTALCTSSTLRFATRVGERPRKAVYTVLAREKAEHGQQAVA